MKSLNRRVMELERKQGKGGLKFRFLTLYAGEAAPKFKDPDVFTMIMRLSGPRPADR